MHYPQDDSPLCCCEYFDRHGNRNHVLGLLCACDDLGGAATAFFAAALPAAIKSTKFSLRLMIGCACRFRVARGTLAFRAACRGFYCRSCS